MLLWQCTPMQAQAQYAAPRAERRTHPRPRTSGRPAAGEPRRAPRRRPSAAAPAPAPAPAGRRPPGHRRRCRSASRRAALPLRRSPQRRRRRQAAVFWAGVGRSSRLSSSAPPTTAAAATASGTICPAPCRAPAALEVPLAVGCREVSTTGRRFFRLLRAGGATRPTACAAPLLPVIAGGVAAGAVSA